MARATTKAAASQSSASKKATGKATTKATSKAKANGLDKFLEGQLGALEDERSNYLRQAETKMAELEARLLRYMVAQTVAIGGIVFALLRLVK